MPYLGLVLTSMGFLVPVMAASRMKKHVDAALLSILTLTSLLYHGTVHPIAKGIDMCTAHATSLFYLCRGVDNLMTKGIGHDLMALLWSGVSIWMYYNRSLTSKDEHTSRMWHMRVHMSANVALMCFLHAPLELC